ncbi:unnamed protein product [Sphacelaria rigidula]
MLAWPLSLQQLTLRKSEDAHPRRCIAFITAHVWKLFNTLVEDFSCSHSRSSCLKDIGVNSRLRASCGTFWGSCSRKPIERVAWPASLQKLTFGTVGEGFKQSIKVFQCVRLNTNYIATVCTAVVAACVEFFNGRVLECFVQGCKAVVITYHNVFVRLRVRIGLGMRTIQFMYEIVPAPPTLLRGPPRFL